MVDSYATFTDEERDTLVALLQDRLKALLIEEHRTRAPSYRQHLLHNEDILRSILVKLGGSPEQP
jgi:hypothetical protein